jgi:hypothetical protein
VNQQGGMMYTVLDALKNAELQNLGGSNDQSRIDYKSALLNAVLRPISGSRRRRTFAPPAWHRLKRQVYEPRGRYCCTPTHKGATLALIILGAWSVVFTSVV